MSGPVAIRLQRRPTTPAELLERLAQLRADGLLPDPEGTKTIGTLFDRPRSISELDRPTDLRFLFARISG